MNYFNAYALSQLANNFGNLLIPTFRNKIDLYDPHSYTLWSSFSVATISTMWFGKHPSVSTSFA